MNIKMNDFNKIWKNGGQALTQILKNKNPREKKVEKNKME